MTELQAATLKRGAYVMHQATATPYVPLRVSEVSLSLRGRVMLRIVALRSYWVPATEYALPAAWRAKKGWWYRKGPDGEWSPVSVDDARAVWQEQRHDG